MKKNRLIAFFVVFSFIGISFVNCDEDTPGDEDIRVTSVKLDEDLKEGLSVEIGSEAINIAGKVTVLPENATNKKAIYASSNSDVATVDEQGKITIFAAGTTTITVTVDEKSDSFTLTVTEKEPIRAAEIQVENAELELTVGESVNIAEWVTVLPEDAENKNVTYASEDETIAEVDAEGNVTAIDAGTVIITIVSEDVPTVKAEIEVTVEDFIGDYPRAGWSVTASQELFIGEGNSLTGAIDGDENTMLALVRPSKTFREISVPSAANGGYIHFVIDMQKPQKVNYFRIRHRNTTQMFLRYMMIEEISGSNDGENFTTIATDVVVTDAEVLEEIESPNISIPVSTYRYLKFYCQKNECFYSMSQGASAQLREVYIGYEPEE